MKKALFNKIMADAKANDEDVVIVFDAMTSCGGFSSTSTHVMLNATDVFEFEDYIYFNIKKYDLLSVQDLTGTVFVEYENIKMVIVKG